MDVNLRQLSHPLAVVIGISFVTYLVFHRFEPDKPTPLFLLLVFVPSILVPVIQNHIFSLPLAVLTTFVSYYALIILYVTLYRLSPFHPLAGYPGPVINRLSKLRMSYVFCTGKQHTYYRTLHQRYGDIVRIGPNEVSVNRADAIQPILGTSGLIKGAWWYNRGPVGTVRSLIAQSDPDEHRKRRRPWDRAFSTASLKNYEEIVTMRSKELVEQFEKRIGQEIDLSLWMNFFAFDFMGDMTFSNSFDLMRNGCDADDVLYLVDMISRLEGMLGHVPWAFSLLRLLPWSAIRERVHAMVAGWVRRRIERGSKIKDLFYYLTDEEGLEPVKPSTSVVFSEGVLAVVAGSHTTASTFGALWHYLLLNPSMFDRLRAEIDVAFPRGEQPMDFTKMANMPYLNACINETLRLLPPVPSGIQRSTPPGSGGKLVGPYFIPEGNQVFVHTYTVQRDPRYFYPFPDTFWPDRWLPELNRRPISPTPPTLSSPVDTKFTHDGNAFIPFSIGPASCVGKNLALLELRGLFCSLVQKFDFRPQQGFSLESWEEGVTDIFIMGKPALPVVVEARR